MTLSNWLYVPPSLEYGIPWIVGPALSIVLALFGLPNVGKVAPVLPPRLDAWIAVFIVLAFANGILLWTHMRTQFVTLKTAAKPFFGTYMTLTVAYLTIFGAIAVMTNRARFTIAEANALDTAQCVVLGLSVVAIALGLSAYFKVEDPGIGPVRLKRAAAVGLLDELRRCSITPSDFDVLLDTLAGLSTTGNTLATQLSRSLDRNLTIAWSDAAKTLHSSLDGISPNDYCGEMRASRESIVVAKLADLKRDI